MGDTGVTWRRGGSWGHEEMNPTEVTTGKGVGRRRKPRERPQGRWDGMGRGLPVCPPRPGSCRQQRCQGHFTAVAALTPDWANGRRQRVLGQERCPSPPPPRQQRCPRSAPPPPHDWDLAFVFVGIFLFLVLFSVLFSFLFSLVSFECRFLFRSFSVLFHFHLIWVYFHFHSLIIFYFHVHFLFHFHFDVIYSFIPISIYFIFSFSVLFAFSFY